MTKKQFLLIISLLTLIGVLIWRHLRDLPEATEAGLPSEVVPQRVPKINDRRILNPPAKVTDLDKVRVSNTVADEWHQGLERSLKNQGGEFLKNTKIEHVESLVWIQHGIALNVESVKITLTNDKNEKTSFRALVDSQNGKILQTWDQPISDPVNPRENPGIRVDPRYLAD